MPLAYYWLSDHAWAAIEPRLPKQRPGPQRLDDRMIISGIVHMLKCGSPWISCPCYYGFAGTVYGRWNKWGRRGIWADIVEALSEEGWAIETARIDEAYIAYHNKTRKPSIARGILPLCSRVAKPRLTQKGRSGNPKRQLQKPIAKESRIVG